MNSARDLTALGWLASALCSLQSFAHAMAHYCAAMKWIAHHPARELPRLDGAAPSEVASFHQRLAGYAPTPIVDAPTLAEQVGVGKVLVKHEQQRFGLPAFKSLGASWAIARELLRRCDPTTQPVESERELAALGAQLGPLTLVTATDGNHGRGVAHWARRFGCEAHILVPHHTSAGRISAIQSEGARVTVVDGDYDETVRRAAALADDRHVVISDTSWPGYVDIPSWIAQGYLTMFHELDAQLEAIGVTHLDGVIVPIGVGGLGITAASFWADQSPRPRLIGVEPYGAECMYESLRRGESVTVGGPQESIMVGMNCGTLSEIAWPFLQDCFSGCVVIEDDYALRAMRAFADLGLVVGETGAASTAALFALAENPSALHGLGLDEESVALTIATESASDPECYRQLVGTTPEAVRSRHTT